MPGNDKANPNIALNEATPYEQMQIRDPEGMSKDYKPYISKDIYGNTIAEPDFSNPTRSRHERPLDTIRSFEAAAYGKELYVGGDGQSEIGLQPGMTRNNSSYYDNRRSIQRNSSTSGYSNVGRNYSYGNMQDAEVDEAGAYETHGIAAAGEPTTPRHNYEYQQPTSASWDQRNQGYGSPVSDSGRAQYNPPVPQKLNYQTPPTPPQDAAKTSESKKKSWGKRLSFGKNKA